MMLINSCHLFVQRYIAICTYLSVNRVEAANGDRLHWLAILVVECLRLTLRRLFGLTDDALRVVEEEAREED